MRIKEININNIVDILIKNSNNNCIDDYEKLMILFIDEFYIDYNKININNVFHHVNGSNIFINDNKKNIKHKNIKRLEFKKLYPNILIKLYDNNIIKFKYDEYAQIYKFIVHNYDDIYNNKNMTDESKFLLKNLLIYVIIASQKELITNIYTFEENIIVNYYTPTLKRLFQECDSVIYVDIDCIFYDCDDDIIIDYIKELNLPYTITYNIDGYFFEKHKTALLYNDIDLKLQGIEHKYKQYNNNYQLAIDDLKYDIIAKNRQKKLNFLLNEKQYSI